MDTELPLQPGDRQRIDVVADLLRSTISGRTALYVAIPVTTGKRFVEWYAKSGRKFDPASREYREEHYRNVIQLNVADARDFIAELRRERGRVVIDPSAFERPEWDQGEYRYFWGKVIERYADTVIFRDGWEYSEGCAFEFLTATRHNVTVLSEDSAPLQRKAGVDLLSRAVKEMKKLSVPAAFLERMIDHARAAKQHIVNNMSFFFA